MQEEKKRTSSTLRRNNTRVSSKIQPCFLTFFSILDELFLISSLELHCYKKRSNAQPFSLSEVGMLLLY